MNLIKSCFFLLSILLPSTGFTQEAVFSEEIKINNLVDGTLLLPKMDGKVPLAILIQGSGPTDRDGNQPNVNNNSLKYLAQGLIKNDIAVFRYDKRLVRLARQGRLVEKNISFDHFIADAREVLDHFKNDLRFSKIIVIGHSQGSLVGMVAAQENRADAFISIAGAGQPIDDVIVDQLGRQAPLLKENAQSNFDDLRLFGAAKNYNPGLASIFRPEIQPFLRTWMEYDPAKEIAKLDMPVLIINGDEDIQVSVSEAEILKEAAKNPEYRIISGMNHIFKEIEKNDTMDNAKSYNEPGRPIMPELVEVITIFIKNTVK